jgi:D-lyxose ketol-isomerase
MDQNKTRKINPGILETLSFKTFIKMITRKQYFEVQQKALELIDKAGIHITPAEREKIAVADFGLSDIYNEGIQVLTFFETDRIAGKILVLLPNQTEPEHWHPPVDNDPGKQEVIRALWGDLRFYVEGENNFKEGFIPKGKDDVYRLRREIILKPGDQLIFQPWEKHWFQAGPEGAVMYSFSTTVRDVLDGFTDPNIVRETKIVED